MERFFAFTLGLALALVLLLDVNGATAKAHPVSSRVESLDRQWLLATDPQNEGRDAQWFKAPQPEAVPTKVPWIIQDAFPGYHGVAWYWRAFRAPPNPHAGGRYLLRFWAVDYKADVWVNGQAVGSHEGGETPFVLDVTGASKQGTSNLVAVRVVNPTDEPIDDLVLRETPARNKVNRYTGGSSYNHGGIVDSVELLVVPAVRVQDVFVRANWKTGEVHVQANARNTLKKTVQAVVQFTVAPAASGEAVASFRLDRKLPPGESLIEARLQVPSHRLWELNDPFLYRVTVRATPRESSSFDEHSVRFGFRDFRFTDGYFRLNGRRIYLRCSHTGNHCPVGLQLPPDPDFLRRDLLNVKVMGFNSIRFIAGVATRQQLDLCDEIGLMVYQESYAGWLLADSPKMKERFDRSTREMIRRDRNHPSVVMWGLLNETSDGPVFRHAVESLPLVRALDDTRLVMLNSGRFDNRTGSGPLAGLEVWQDAASNPNVTHNATNRPIVALGITWAPGQLAFHPGQAGEFSVVRWTCPESGEHELAATFTGIAGAATTDFHVLHNGRSLHDGFINVRGSANTTAFTRKLLLAAGDRLDFVVGFGNGDYGGDTTALAVRIKSPGGKMHDAAAEFSLKANPNGRWTYGSLAPGTRPDAATFKSYTVPDRPGGGAIGSLSNPGSREWEDVLSDQHPYQRTPHTADIIRKLRALHDAAKPVFLSEYGVGSAVDLFRVTRHYERLGKAHVEDARFYRDKLDRFLVDWERWGMAEVFGRPEDFFAASLLKMAGERLLGLNAIRSNAEIIAHSLTGTVDQGMSGEGLFTTWRELKPGTVDAVFDGWAPLRWCLFVEPVHFYRGERVHLEAVLANEDQLAAGEYVARLQVFGPNNEKLWGRTAQVRIAAPGSRPEPSFALPVLAEDAVIDGPPGKYRFVASFDQGAAPLGGEVFFHVGDRAELPRITSEVVLWGDDPTVSKWLSEQRITVRTLDAGQQSSREVILAGARPPAPGGAPAFTELLRHVARGSTVIFLAPEVFAHDKQPLRWLPLARKGTLTKQAGWLYHKDEWARRHPMFAGLPTGMMNYLFYRELIPDHFWSGQDAPAEAIAGANNASIEYSSGLMLSVHGFGAGRFLLNTLRLRENLSKDPAADRLLVNLLQYAAPGQPKSLADLPADFEAQLKSFGYE
ncbi:MAG: glycoside hydrolase family 2 [Verrucomicrobia bacterium]|nr:glycoside hydrolase family 2 [Verrucomicrobiota bacterium]